MDKAKEGLPFCEECNTHHDETTGCVPEPGDLWFNYCVSCGYEVSQDFDSTGDECPKCDAPLSG